ncbi:M28 family peptidase [Massilia sp. R2A-15]|uniref:M28 family peptidase n=1 Tax=Massilia sp. R2A-15 TaxID=3064278 RepID=UPI0027377735|nr:M28 family peptidase [Massilia sp. R2A-15]WLI89028.1 M28 family peptidase [Massilia sp. R2A-15]
MTVLRLIPLRAILSAAAIALCTPSMAHAATPAPLPPDTVRLLGHISADTMRTHLTYLASDELGGRGTPSPGLDLAADYIAAQFRRAGLEPLGDDGYFQTADWNLINPRRHKNPPAPDAAPVKVRNVVGILRGSDPVLRDTYILVTAHYDHLGTRPGSGDQIYNGANDDGSGTVSVIELASAFAAQPVRPKRSIVFMTVFGEEHGMVGSRYYGAHPLVPVERTVAGINLEQVGRTDDDEGEQKLSAGVTGFDFSEVGAILRQAGEQTGIRIWKHPVNSDRYFALSDNQALANHGIPSHTVSVAYSYPDYHRATDHADKIDYDNMAAVDRAMALGISMIANNPKAPAWDTANPKAADYLKIWNQRNLK